MTLALADELHRLLDSDVDNQRGRVGLWKCGDSTLKVRKTLFADT